MYKKFIANKDSFIDKKLGENNFGKDELLEIGRVVSSSAVYPKRALISFDISEISSSMASGLINSASQFELVIFSNQGENMLQDGFYVDAYVISSSWYEGTGSVSDNNESGSVSWISASTAVWDTEGGDYLSSPTASQYFPTSSGDISMDVTTIISQSINDEYNNYGFLLRLRDESTLQNQDSKFLYSKDSYTIYDPVIYAKWNDVSTTASVSDSTNGTEYSITLKDAKDVYSIQELVYCELHTRLLDPTLTFDTSVGSLSSIPLTNLAWSIVDSETKETVIPFSPYTSCSYDDSKNYWNIDMGVLQPNRTYELKLQHSFSNSVKRFHNIHSFRTME